MSSIQSRIVRYGELRPCKTAFIDAHTPGSDQKENFTIVGGGRIGNALMDMGDGSDVRIPTTSRAERPRACPNACF